MFNSKFTEICLFLVLSDGVDKDIIQDIIFLLEKYREESKIDFRSDNSLVSLLYWIANEKLKILYQGKSNVLFSEMLELDESSRFKIHYEYIKALERESREDTDKFLKYLEILKNKRKLCEFVGTKNEFIEFFRMLERNEISSDSELLKRWKWLITRSYENILQIDRHERLLEMSTLNLAEDGFKKVLSDYVSFDEQSGRRVIPSGYDFLDSDVLVLNGFESRRLYIVAGSSGVGKSMFLINLLVNAVKKCKNISSEQNKEKVLVYITAENMLNETLLRFYSCLMERPVNSILSKMLSFETKEEYDEFVEQMEKEVKEVLKKSGVNVVFKYVLSHETTVFDIENFLGMYLDKYDVLAVYIDYLDLLATKQKFSEYRRELAHITQQLKNMAIQFNIPVITASQLNREGYDAAKAKLTQISESIEKVNKADFVLFLQDHVEKYVVDKNTSIEYKKIRVSVLKNRNGVSDYVTDLFVPMKKVSGEKIFCYKMLELSDVYFASDEIPKKGTINDDYEFLMGLDDGKETSHDEFNEPVERSYDEKGVSKETYSSIGKTNDRTSDDTEHKNGKEVLNIQKDHQISYAEVVLNKGNRNGKRSENIDLEEVLERTKIVSRKRSTSEAGEIEGFKGKEKWGFL